MTREELIRLAVRYAHKSIKESGLIPRWRLDGGYDYKLHKYVTIHQPNKWANRCTAILEKLNEPFYNDEDYTHYRVFKEEGWDFPRLTKTSIIERHATSMEEIRKHKTVETLWIFR